MFRSWLTVDRIMVNWPDMISMLKRVLFGSRYPNPSHHRGTEIIAPAIRWTARSCDRKGDTRYTERLSFRSRLSSGIRLRWCTVRVKAHRSDLVKPLCLPGRRHCWWHASTAPPCFFFHWECNLLPIVGVPLGFSHSGKSLSFQNMPLSLLSK